MKKHWFKILTLALCLCFLAGCGKQAADGRSAYEIAVAHGFTGTEAEWLASLQGAAGTAGTDGKSGQDGADGQDGSNGKNGANGKSAYEIAVEYGYTGSEEDFARMLMGLSPESAAGDQVVDTDSSDRVGTPGKSAYEVAVDHGFIGTEDEWLESLKAESVSPELNAVSYGIYPGAVDMDAMNELLTYASEENRTIRFADGVYVFPSTIHILSNTSIIGSTNTVFKLSESSTSNTLLNIGSLVDNVYLAHLILQGNAIDTPTKQGSKIGLSVSGAMRVNIENVEITGFDLYGFYGSQMSSNANGDFYKMLQITNCRFYGNYYGMCLGPRCEYTQVLNCVFGNNQVGCLNQGGNNIYTSCIFNVNQIGFQMDSKGLSNPAHGGCNSCTFNHNTRAIVVNDCQIGWVFNGCQIFYGNVELNECQGVIFNSSIFGSCVLHSTHSSLQNVNLISDSFFQTSSVGILAYNDGSTFVTNCIPDFLGQHEDPSQEDPGWNRILYTQPANVASAASADAYFAILSCPIPENTPIDILDIAVQKATAEGQSVEGVDVWIGNAETGELIEQIVTDATLTTVFSSDLKKYVLRISIGNTYNFPTFIALEATRTNDRGIAYSTANEAINYFSGEPVSVGDVLVPNSRYVAEFAVYSLPQDE